MQDRDLKIGGQITYGLRGRDLVHITDAERGLACACICAGCKQPLIARKGPIMAHHFAHSGENCEGGVETALHFAAKEILAKSGHIVLPPVIIGNVRLAEEKTFEIERVNLEHRLESIVPDVILYIRGVPLLIEVTVTHGIDTRKYAEIRRIGISTLEITLGDLKSDWNLNELRPILVGSSDRKQWVCNVYAENWPHFKNMVVIRRGYASHVDGCPIPARVWRDKPYANVIHDCVGCAYFGSWTPGPDAEFEEVLPASHGAQMDQMLEVEEADGLVTCAGHFLRKRGKLWQAPALAPPFRPT